MGMRLKNCAWQLGTAALVCVGMSAAAQDLKSNPANGITDTEIKLGWMGDLTGPGAPVGVPDLRGLQAFADHVNSQGGILGRKLKVMELDDKFMADNGTVNFRRLVNDDQVLAIANMGGSQITTPLGPTVNATQIPVVFPYQTVDAQLDVPYFFNLTSHYADQADVIVAHGAQVVGGADKLKIFVARLSVPSGEEFDRYVQEAVKVQGGEYLGSLTIDATQSEYTPTVVQLIKAKEAGANYIALHAPARSALGLFNTMSKLGLDMPIGGIQALATPDVFRRGPAEIIDEFVAVQSVLPPGSGVPGGEEIRSYIQEHPNYSDDAMEPYFSQGWITGKFFKAAVEAAAKAGGGEVTRQALFEAMKTTFDTGGLSCALDFTAGPKNYTPCATTIVWNGESLVAESPFETFTEILRAPYRN